MGFLASRFCLDTDFLVNFLRGSREEVVFINRHEGRAVLATTYSMRN